MNVVDMPFLPEYNDSRIHNVSVNGNQRNPGRFLRFVPRSLVEDPMKILVCDKTEKEAVERMRAAGLQVDVRDNITPEELPGVLPAYDGMVVRSRTKVRQPLIDVCPKLKIIVRGGVGLDTIDAEYARSKGITVMNTPMASSASVAELAVGYMFALARSTYQAASSMKAENGKRSCSRATRSEERPSGWSVSATSVGRLPAAPTR
jgi:phosphoglycerate dehydrogenase-like enzyme